MQPFSLAKWNLNWMGERDDDITCQMQIRQVGSASLKELKKVSRWKGLNWGLRGFEVSKKSKGRR